MLDTYLHDRWKGQEWIPDGKQAEQLTISKTIFGPYTESHAEANLEVEVVSHER